MKSIIIVFAIILSASTLSAQSSRCAELDAKNGFRTHTFGDSKEKMGVVVFDTTDFEYGIVPSEDMKVGEVEAAGITYGFYKNQLCKVTVLFRDKEDLKEVLELLMKKYPGAKADSVVMWSGDLVVMMGAVLDEVPTIIMLSGPIARMKEKDIVESVNW